MDNVTFQVNKDENGAVKGFTLEGLGCTDSESYCLSFIKAQQLGRADIRFENGQIIFFHDGVSLDEANNNFGPLGIHEGGIFSAPINSEEQEQLQDLLNCKGLYSGNQIRVKIKLDWSKGFTLYTAKQE